MKIFRISCAILALFAQLTVFAACSQKMTGEDRVKEAVKRAVAAAEAKDVSGFMKFISKGYSDEQRNDYETIKGIVFYHLMKKGGVSVFVRSLSAEVKGTDAIVEARAVLVRTQGIKDIKNVLPDEAEAYRFNIVMKKEQDVWKAVNAGWAPVGVAGLL